MDTMERFALRPFFLFLFIVVVAAFYSVEEDLDRGRFLLAICVMSVGVFLCRALDTFALGTRWFPDADEPFEKESAKILKNPKMWTLFPRQNRYGLLGIFFCFGSTHSFDLSFAGKTGIGALNPGVFAPGREIRGASRWIAVGWVLTFLIVPTYIWHQCQHGLTFDREAMWMFIGLGPLGLLPLIPYYFLIPSPTALAGYKANSFPGKYLTRGLESTFMVLTFIFGFGFGLAFNPELAGESENARDCVGTLKSYLAVTISVVWGIGVSLILVSFASSIMFRVMAIRGRKQCG